KQLTELATQIDENATERSRQIDGIDRHLDCIVYFFSQKDRSQKAIDDIDDCRISVNEYMFYSQPAKENHNSEEALPIEQQALEDTPPYPQKSLVEKTVDGILSIPEVITNTLKGIL